MKYIVMECHEAYCVLLDSEGRFTKACNKHYEVGQYVTDPVILRDDSELLDNVYRIDKRRKAFRISFAAVLIAVFLCFNFFNLVLNDYKAIYISINPEIRIDINRLGFVTEIKGLNADGEVLLEKCNTKSKDEAVLCKNIIKEAFNSGFLENGGKVSVYVDSPDDKHFRETGTLLSQAFEEFNEGEYSADIEILSFSQYVFDSALPENGTSDATEYTSEEVSSDKNTESSAHRHGGHKNNDCDNDEDDDNDGLFDDLFDRDD